MMNTNKALQQITKIGISKPLSFETYTAKPLSNAQYSILNGFKMPTTN